ncbi:hypothetical protein [Halorussus caseinilyticus]|uniref:Uncharacterized protein n=1 Tax=Halorussus caseinilyticus TaxID=3034025 RepID=A0ABD5WQ29_9EURY
MTPLFADTLVVVALVGFYGDSRGTSARLPSFWTGDSGWDSRWGPTSREVSGHC